MQLAPKFYNRKSQLPRGTAIVDAIDSAFHELYFLDHPRIQKGTQKQSNFLKYCKSLAGQDVWVYYPWRQTAVHIPNKRLFYKLRTARNKNLISLQEQRVFANSTIGIAGLSVGSAAVATLVATGGSQTIKLADPDILEITNLNRIRGTVLDIGSCKVDIAARAAWEVDPFLSIERWQDGVQPDTIKQFVTTPKLDVFVDEMDDIKMKLLARTVCRTYKVPVVMATDNGDSIIVDVERFDIEPERPIFHGRIRFSDTELENITRDTFVALANEIIDPSFFTTAQQVSILEIGKTLSGVPQLGTAAALAGAAVAYVVRRIINKASLPSGRYVIGFEEVFIPGYNSKAEKKRRVMHTTKFKNFYKNR